MKSSCVRAGIIDRNAVGGGVAGGLEELHVVSTGEQREKDDTHQTEYGNSATIFFHRIRKDSLLSLHWEISRSHKSVVSWGSAWANSRGALRSWGN